MTQNAWPTPTSLLPKWKTRFENNAPAWLIEKGDWPQSWPLRPPTERMVVHNACHADEWIRVWQDWERRNGAGAIQWVERLWPRLGRQRLPESVQCRTPAELAAWIGESERWQRAKKRSDDLLMRSPALANVASRHFSWLADETDDEYARHMTALFWLAEHPHSGLYPRQLPIPGVDSKWLERRKAWIKAWLTALRSESARNDDFYILLGLRRLPAMLQMRMHDPMLRGRVGGLAHIECPIAEAATLDWPVKSVLIVENRQSGMAVDPPDKVVVIMALGYALGHLPSIPWLAKARIGYWSDLDTHGFAMLHRLRTYFPQTESLLMDADTMLLHKNLWARESVPSSTEVLPSLTPEELTTYQRFKSDWKGMRLEQERIDWNHALSAITPWMNGCGNQFLRCQKQPTLPVLGSEGDRETTSQSLNCLEHNGVRSVTASNADAYAVAKRENP